MFLTLSCIVLFGSHSGHTYQLLIKNPLQIPIPHLGIPTDAYYAIEEVHDDGTPSSKTFNHVASEIGAEEAEEVGVEHLLRDIRDTTIGSLSQSVSSQLQSVKGLMSHTQHIEKYLAKVASFYISLDSLIISTCSWHWF